MSALHRHRQIEALLGKLDEVAEEIRRLCARTTTVVAPPGQGSLWEDAADHVVDLKEFALDLLERARWCPEPTWPRIRRALVDEFEVRLWASLDALGRPELADIDDLEALLFEVEAQTYALLRRR